MRLLFAVLSVLMLSGPVVAQDTALQSLLTGDQSKGWEAVGRLDLGKRGFCTASLIEEDVVLTAAHCLFDKETNVRVPNSEIRFLAGWRNGRAAAYRGVKASVAHPEYVFGGSDLIRRVPYDIALLQLDQPIRLPSLKPFAIGQVGRGETQVGIVSYAHDRAEAPSLQEMCHVLDRATGMMVLSCTVDFGSSGAPIFDLTGSRPLIVSLVSAKAEAAGRNVSLGVELGEELTFLRTKLQEETGTMGVGNVRILSGGAKFIKPDR